MEWLTNHTKHDRKAVMEMFEGFCNDFHGGLELDQFTALFPDLNSGIATANLVFRYVCMHLHTSVAMFHKLNFRVLDEDQSGQLGFKEFLQAIDLVGAR